MEQLHKSGVETNTNVEILEGSEALNLLTREEFLVQWDALYHDCPWATVFQSKEFVGTWFKLYQIKYRPIIVKATQNGKLNGLLTLAMLDKGELHGAGGKHAEYQTWLSEEKNAESFIKLALSGLRKKYPGSDIKLKFLPERTPLAWVKTDPIWRNRCVLRAFDQPLLIVDEDGINNELRKKNRREKINRLKRQGDLKFERIQNLRHFNSVFETIVAQYDFRNGARYNKIPSQTDPLRNKLIQELYKLNLLHATILKVNDEIIAASIIAIGNKWLHLWGISSYSPSYAKYSPSILHFLMLGRMLIDEGFVTLDLTPGDDPYKQELATSKVTAYELCVAGSITSLLKSTAVNLLWNKLAGAGINRKVLKDLFIKKLHLVRYNGWTSLVLTSKNRTDATRACTYLVLLIKDTGNFREVKRLNRNNLNDFLAYAPTKGEKSRWEFLEEAMKRFEAGQCSYTFVQEGALILCLWVAPSKILQSIPRFALLDTTHPDKNCVLLNVYYHTSCEGKLDKLLQAFLFEAVQPTETSQIFATVDDIHTPLYQALLAIGFNPILEEATQT